MIHIYHHHQHEFLRQNVCLLMIEKIRNKSVSLRKLGTWRDVTSGGIVFLWVPARESCVCVLCGCLKQKKRIGKKSRFWDPFWSFVCQVFFCFYIFKSFSRSVLRSFTCWVTSTSRISRKICQADRVDDDPKCDLIFHIWLDQRASGEILVHVSPSCTWHARTQKPVE